MDPSQEYFAHLMHLLRTSNALKESFLALDEPEVPSIFTSLTRWILAQLSAMNSYLWDSIKDIPIIQRMRDREYGRAKYVPGALVGMCVSTLIPGLSMLAIGAAAGVTVQWLLSTFRSTREPFIGFLEKYAWPIAGAIFGLWICNMLGAIAGCLLFYWEIDNYKSMVDALIGLTEEARDILVSRIRELVDSPETENLTRFISDHFEKKKLLRILFDYFEPPLPDPSGGWLRWFGCMCLCACMFVWVRND